MGIAENSIAENNGQIEPPRFWQFLTDEDISDDDLAEEYHEASKFYRSTLSRSVRTEAFLRDERLRRSATIGARALPHLPLVPLPAIDPNGERSRSSALIRRPSCREFAARPLPIEELGRLLWLSYGAYPDELPGAGGRRRPVGSGGGLYPLEVYLIASIDGSSRRGLYHYDVHGHALEEVRPEVTTDDLRRLGSPADYLVAAPVIVLITGLFWRSRVKYRLRGYRFALLEAGALIQQLTLVGQVLGLGALPFACLFDDVVEDLCELDGVDESFLNAVLLGYPA